MKKILFRVSLMATDGNVSSVYTRNACNIFPVSKIKFTIKNFAAKSFLRMRVGTISSNPVRIVTGASVPIRHHSVRAMMQILFFRFRFILPHTSFKGPASSGGRSPKTEPWFQQTIHSSLNYKKCLGLHRERSRQNHFPAMTGYINR